MAHISLFCHRLLSARWRPLGSVCASLVPLAVGLAIHLGTTRLRELDPGFIATARSAAGAGAIVPGSRAGARAGDASRTPTARDTRFPGQSASTTSRALRTVVQALPERAHGGDVGERPLAGIVAAFETRIARGDATDGGAWDARSPTMPEPSRIGQGRRPTRRLAAVFLPVLPLSRTVLGELGGWLMLLLGVGIGWWHSAIARKRLAMHAQNMRRRAEQALAQIRTLQTVTDAVLGATNTSELLSQILEQVRVALAAQTAVVFLSDPRTGNLVLRAAQGVIADGPFTIPMGSGVIGRIAETGVPTIVPDLDAVAEVMHRTTLRHGVRALMAAPLRVRGREIGLLEVGASERGQFSHDDLRLLQIVADRIASALDRARLYEEERRARSDAEAAGWRARFLDGVSRTLSTNLEYEETLQRVAELTVPALADVCLIDMVHNDATLRRVAAVAGPRIDPAIAPQDLTRIPTAADTVAALTRIVATGEPLVLHDLKAALASGAMTDPERLRLIDTANLTAGLVVPLTSRTHVLGALTLLASGDRRYGPADIALAQELGRRAAQAVDNARLYQLSTDARARLEESEQRYRSLFAYHPDAVFSLDLDGRFRSVNKRVEELTKVAADAMIGQPLLPLIYVADRESAHQRFELAACGEPQHFEARIVPEDGRMVVLAITYLPIVVDGTIVGVYGIARNITRQKRAERDLQRQAVVYDVMHDAVLLLDADMRIVDSNPAASRVFGYPREALVGMVGARLHDPAVGSRVARAIDEALKREGQWSGEVVIRRPDGSVGVVEAIVIAHQNAGDSRVAYLSVSRDISERRRAEEALRASEERYRLMVEGSALVFFFSYDMEGRFTYLSPSVRETLGYEPEELIGRPLQSLLLPEATRATLRWVRETAGAEREGPATYPLVVRHRDGRPVVLEIVEGPVVRGGTVAGAQGFARDITERRQAEDAKHMLMEAGRLLANSVAGAPEFGALADVAVAAFADVCLIALAHDDGTLERVACATANATDRTLLGSSVDPLPESVVRTACEGRATYLPDLLTTPDDGADAAERRTLYAILRPTSALVAPMIARGRVLGVITLVRTTWSGRRFAPTDLAHAEELAHRVAMVLDNATLFRDSEEARQRYELLFEETPQAMWVFDRESLQFLAVNAAAVATYGYSRNELQQMTILDLWPVEERDRAAPLITSAPGTIRMRHRRKDDSFLDVECTYLDLVFMGRSARMVMAQDITERLRAQEIEEQLRRSERLATLGDLAATMMHEVKQPLNAIVNTAHMLRYTRGALLTEAARQDVALIEQEANRAIGAMHHWLGAAGHAGGTKKPLDLTDVVGRIIAGRSYTLRSLNITPLLTLASRLPPVLGDQQQLEGMLLNIVVNAEYVLAQQGGGYLMIETRAEGAEVVLRVTDSGPGIPADVLPRIFERFYTTKGRGEGSGLGLSVAQGVITEHGGQIHASNVPGGGACFTVRLPAITTEGVMLADAAAAPLRVLILDDEASFRESVTAVLERTGRYVLRATHNGLAAIDWILHDEVDLAIVDIRMPGLSGPEFWSIVSELSPQFCRRIGFMTGDAQGRDTRAFLADARRPVLHKPFTADELVQFVAALADDALARPTPTRSGPLSVESEIKWRTSG